MRVCTGFVNKLLGLLACTLVFCLSTPSFACNGGGDAFSVSYCPELTLVEVGAVAAASLHAIPQLDERVVCFRSEAACRGSCCQSHETLSFSPTLVALNGTLPADAENPREGSAVDFYGLPYKDATPDSPDKPPKV